MVNKEFLTPLTVPQQMKFVQFRPGNVAENNDDSENDAYGREYE